MRGCVARLEIMVFEGRSWHSISHRIYDMFDVIFASTLVLYHTRGSRCEAPGQHGELVIVPTDTQLLDSTPLVIHNTGIPSRHLMSQFPIFSSLRCAFTSHPPEYHCLEKTGATKTILTVDATNDFAGREEPNNGLA